MAGLSYSGLVTQIRNYTETDSNVLTTDILENIILNAQYRILRDVPIDADRKQQSVNLVPGQETINAPAGCLFIRAIQVYDSSSVLTGTNVFLEKKDMSYLQEYQPVTGTSAAQGKPKYYASFGGATGDSDTTSGRIFLAPTPKRGKTNIPAFIVHTIRQIGDILNINHAEVEKITSDNFFRLFKEANIT